MDWMKQLLPVLQAGLSVYTSGQFLKKSSEGAKAVAVQSSVIAFGSMSFLILFIAAVIMSFVDLGIQLEAGTGVHFSGMMQSSFIMFVFGLIIFGIGVLVAKYLAAEEKKKKKEVEVAVSPYAPLLLFGEELLKQILANLAKPESAGASGPASADESK